MYSTLTSLETNLFIIKVLPKNANEPACMVIPIPNYNKDNIPQLKEALEKLGEVTVSQMAPKGGQQYVNLLVRYKELPCVPCKKQIGAESDSSVIQLYDNKVDETTIVSLMHQYLDELLETIDNSFTYTGTPDQLARVNVVSWVMSHDLDRPLEDIGYQIEEILSSVNKVDNYKMFIALEMMHNISKDLVLTKMFKTPGGNEVSFGDIINFLITPGIISQPGGGGLVDYLSTVKTHMKDDMAFITMLYSPEGSTAPLFDSQYSIDDFLWDGISGNLGETFIIMKQSEGYTENQNKLIVMINELFCGGVLLWREKR